MIRIKSLALTLLVPLLIAFGAVVDGIVLRFSRTPCRSNRDLPSASCWGLLLPVAVGLLAAMLVTSCGCAPSVKVSGGQTHEVKVHHDPQRTDVWIHRDRRRKPNPPPPERKNP